MQHQQPRADHCGNQSPNHAHVSHTSSARRRAYGAARRDIRMIASAHHRYRQQHESLQKQTGAPLAIIPRRFDQIWPIGPAGYFVHAQPSNGQKFRRVTSTRSVAHLQSRHVQRLSGRFVSRRNRSAQCAQRVAVTSKRSQRRLLGCRQRIWQCRIGDILAKSHGHDSTPLFPRRFKRLFRPLARRRRILQRHLRPRIKVFVNIRQRRVQNFSSAIVSFFSGIVLPSNHVQSTVDNLQCRLHAIVFQSQPMVLLASRL